MRYVSLFSDIEAATHAWHPLGWHCVAVAEIEPFPSRVLAQHYPNTPNLGDVTAVTEDDIKRLGPVDLLVFGSPCQDLSVAGKRKGLDGERSGLFFTAMRIAGWMREHCGLRWALWENVLGAFSSNEGRDFAAVVDHMAGVAGTEVPPKGWGGRRRRHRQRSTGRMVNSRRAMVRSGATAPSRVRSGRFWKLGRSTAGTS